MDVTVSSQLHQNDKRNEGKNEPTLCVSNPAVNTPASTSRNVTFSYCWHCHKKSIGKRVLLPLIHVQGECMYNTYNRCPLVSVGAFAFPQMNWSQTLNGLLSIPAGAWMAEWQTISEPALLTEHLLLDISCHVNKKFVDGGDKICWLIFFFKYKRYKVSDTGRGKCCKDLYLKNK